ncbi:MAG TPA: alkaline phosphatase family protein [Rugosimonospora sp.]|nr:alkaline phosphatase family protein [Rugosimonospora sp.]
MYRNFFAALLVIALLLFLGPNRAVADGNLTKVNHIIIVMQENHSYDNYFGVLAYAPGTPYHNGNGPCSPKDHQCVDGLTCKVDSTGNLTCSNSNRDANSSIVTAFHEPTRCVVPDLDHSWFGTHREANFSHPNDTLTDFLANGFVRVNDLTEQPDNGSESPTDDETIGYYTQSDLPFYYDLAENFAISDRHFASLLGPTFPNRSYLMAATSFGHLTTSDIFPPPGGYKPITGTIFDLLNKYGISWADYFQDAPQAASFYSNDPHFLPLSVFLAQAAGFSGVGSLPQVSFLDPDFGLTGTALENDEHPPTDIQRGQAYVSDVVNTVRNGPHWKDSIIFITYDEHGGFYDHAKSPRARQGRALTPDGIVPGQCEDLSDPPASEQPGGGAECSYNFVSATDTSVADAEQLCPALASNPTGPYPADCANFNQLGIRVPLIAISPFSKPRYVSHTIGDHTSLLALIERRFLTINGVTQHLTKRDEHANPLEDIFDFEHSPSLDTTLNRAEPPADDCTPLRALP